MKNQLKKLTLLSAILGIATAATEKEKVFVIRLNEEEFTPYTGVEQGRCEYGATTCFYVVKPGAEPPYTQDEVEKYDPNDYSHHFELEIDSTKLK